MEKYSLQTKSIPLDDGACDHLLGKLLPSLKFRATNDQFVDLSQLGEQRTVLYIYPMTMTIIFFNFILPDYRFSFT